MTSVLVTYASKSGSTAEVAEFMGEALREAGASVDVKPVKTAHEMQGYDLVFVGSAIRVGKWLGEAVQFVEEHKTDLAKQPTAFFTVCLTMQENTPEKRAEVQAYLDPVREIFTPQAEEFFAGVAQMERLGFIERMAMKAIKPPLGDFRDWAAIRAWTLEVYQQLSASGA
ncbi:MAG: flavodoxin domain-containing protein [Anaerolineae bacterium]|nr:flavodoxin domain-containing protein [Anaerolineae bacterium]